MRFTAARSLLGRRPSGGGSVEAALRSCALPAAPIIDGRAIRNAHSSTRLRLQIPWDLRIAVCWPAGDHPSLGARKNSRPGAVSAGAEFATKRKSRISCADADTVRTMGKEHAAH